MKRSLKRHIFFLLAFIWLWLLPARTMAFTLEPRVGFGQVIATNIETGGDVIQTGLDIYFYEGRNLDLFVGAEHTSTINLDTKFRISGESFGSSVEITAATFGIHIKPATSSRFKPYLSLGGIGGKVDYEAKGGGGSSISMLSQSTDSTNFMTYRAGLGMDIGLGKRFGLGLEASYTGPFPVFKAVIANQATGEVKEIRLWEDNSQLVFSLGLLYSF